MRRIALALVLAVLNAGRVSAEDAAAELTRGKLEADLGRYLAAAAAFESAVRAPGASVEQRWEALVRLGAARRDAGDARRSADAFEETWRTYGRDREALRFLLQGLGSALPGRERWEQIWKQVSLQVDRSVPERPEVRVAWPGVTRGLCPCTGAPIDVDFEEKDLQDVFALIADVSGMNLVVQPSAQGFVTYRATRAPWDEVLDRVLAPNRLIALRDGNVVWIGPPEEAGESRTFRGRPIDFDLRDVDLRAALEEIAAHGRCRVELQEGITGRVTFKLQRVPWDQAFDLMCLANGLAWKRSADVIRVRVRPRPGPAHGEHGEGTH